MVSPRDAEEEPGNVIYPGLDRLQKLAGGVSLSKVKGEEGSPVA